MGGAVVSIWCNMDKLELLLHSAMQQGLPLKHKQCCEVAKNTGQMVMVIADLDDEYGKAVATWDTNYQTIGPKDGENMWTFGYPLEEWQRKAKELRNAQDDFTAPFGSMLFAVVSGDTPYIGFIAELAK